jgi:hypothetical protein
MVEPSPAPGAAGPQFIENVGDLKLRAIRCYRLAGGLANSDASRQLVALGQDYAAKAIELGADPASLPRPEEWRAVRG